jgi:hypothetical protein
MDVDAGMMKTLFTFEQPTLKVVQRGRKGSRRCYRIRRITFDDVN